MLSGSWSTASKHVYFLLLDRDVARAIDERTEEEVIKCVARQQRPMPVRVIGSQHYSTTKILLLLEKKGNKKFMTAPQSSYHVKVKLNSGDEVTCTSAYALKAGYYVVVRAVAGGYRVVTASDFFLNPVLDSNEFLGRVLA